jgi:hypothetical protein
MNDEQARRLATNEVVFRTVNEQIVSLNEAFEPFPDNAAFICECSRIDCMEPVEIALAEYALVRRNPRLFLVSPSEEHVVASIERIVERAEGYFVVEKLDDAAEVAEQLAGQ